MGQDASFDLLNYHLYLPFAFLQQRAGDIIAAGAVHSFFNPLPDIPYYLFFVWLNDWPRLTAFVQGAWYGLFLFVVWRLTAYAPVKERQPLFLLRVGLFFFTATGSAVLLQVGRATNEVQMAFLCLAGVWLLFNAAEGKKHSVLKLTAAAFLAGAIAGLKYTAAPGALALCAGCAAAVRKQSGRFRIYGWLALCAAAGFLLTDGYFLWQKYSQLGNPFFPFFNQIFHSPYFSQQSLSNGLGTPAGLSDWLFWPFLRFHYFVLEYRLDARLALGWLAALCLLVFGGARKWRLTQRESLWLLLWGITYVFWVLFYGNMRYSICLEVFSSFLLLGVCARFISARTVALGALVCALLLQAIFPLPDWHRQPFGNKNISFSKQISLPDDAFVLAAGHISFLIPFLNPHARYSGGIWFPPEKFPQADKTELRRLNRLQRADYQHHFAPLIKQQVARHTGPVYVLSPFTPLLFEPDFWQTYGVRPPDQNSRCRVFAVSLDLFYDMFVLCRVQKVPQLVGK